MRGRKWVDSSLLFTVLSTVEYLVKQILCKVKAKKKKKSHVLYLTHRQAKSHSSVNTKSDGQSKENYTGTA